MDLNTHNKDILIEDYNYYLPDERIAKYPLSKRDESQLLIYKKGEIRQDIFKNAVDYLPEKALLVYNNTKVIHARLLFQKTTGATIEIFCLEPLEPSDYALSLSATTACTWKCLIGNRKKWKEGSLQKSIAIGTQTIILKASLLKSERESNHIHFSWDGAANISFAELLTAAGELPIPPYLHRKTEESDKQSYQTIYSKRDGSVAAPTAGLHFTEAVLESFNNKQIQREELTLHIGAGTFQPVKSAKVSEHTMHTELFVVDLQTITNLLQHVGNIIAVGTTTVRTLESLYQIGLQIINGSSDKTGHFNIGQWDAYVEKTDISAERALTAILEYLKLHKLQAVQAHTQIIIQPGYEFKIVDAMFTNFHQSKSTLLLLVSAFIGKDWKRIYDYAYEHKFRFLSYGDSCLLLKE